MKSIKIQKKIKSCPIISLREELYKPEQCACCEGKEKKKITLVCNRCKRVFCDSSICWVDASSQYFQFPLSNDGYYHMSNCDRC